jgi:hypothetical protein
MAGMSREPREMPLWGYWVFVLPALVFCGYQTYRIGIPANPPYLGYLLIAINAGWVGLAIYLIAKGLRARRP